MSRMATEYGAPLDDRRMSVLVAITIENIWYAIGYARTQLCKAPIREI